MSLHNSHKHECLHLGFEIAKLALRGVAATAAVCIAKNLYELHRTIERHRK